MYRKPKGGHLFTWLILFMLPLYAGCALDTAGMLIEIDTMVSDDDAADGDTSVDIDADDHRPDGDVPYDPPADDGVHPDMPDAETEDPATCAEMPSSYCDDSLDCTTDTCRDDPAGPTCVHALLSGFCLIENTCRVAWTADPANECQICDPAYDETWTPVADGTVCYSLGGGRCCSGWCVPWANCCFDYDCNGCTGMAEPCSTFDDQYGCETQDGCGWMPSGSCTGGYSCITWNGDESTCILCGCYYRPGDCDPGTTVHDCSGHSYLECELYGSCGCSWEDLGGLCDGYPTACWEFDSSSCEYQSGCNWQEGGTCNRSTGICAY